MIYRERGLQVSQMLALPYAICPQEGMGKLEARCNRFSEAFIRYTTWVLFGHKARKSPDVVLKWSYFRAAPGGWMAKPYLPLTPPGDLDSGYYV